MKKQLSERRAAFSFFALLYLSLPNEENVDIVDTIEC